MDCFAALKQKIKQAGGTASDGVCLRQLPSSLLPEERGIFMESLPYPREVESTDPQLLLSIPSSLTISSAVAIQSPVVKNAVLHINANDSTALALLLLTERALGDRSNWDYYIRSLPSQVPNALYFTKGDLAALDGTPLGKAAVAKMQQLDRQYKSITDILSQWKTEYGLPSTSASLDDFIWANAMVLSRALSLPSFARPPPTDIANLSNDRVLVPLLDMFNHSSCHQNTFWSVSKGDGSICVYANTPSSSNEPLTLFSEQCISYGEKPAIEWLYEYGFLPNDYSQHDAWPFVVELAGSPEIVAIKQMWMHELGLVPRIMLTDSLDNISGQIMLTLCLAALDDTAGSLCARVLRNCSIKAQHPYFIVNDELIDDDDKLLQISGIQHLALLHCLNGLQHSLYKMSKADLSSCSAPVAMYVKAEADLLHWYFLKLAIAIIT